MKKYFLFILCFFVVGSFAQTQVCTLKNRYLHVSQCQAGTNPNYLTRISIDNNPNHVNVCDSARIEVESQTLDLSHRYLRNNFCEATYHGADVITRFIVGDTPNLPSACAGDIFRRSVPASGEMPPTWDLQNGSTYLHSSNCIQTEWANGFFLDSIIRMGVDGSSISQNTCLGDTARVILEGPQTWQIQECTTPQCTEGQYWCGGQNACLAASQACTTTCTNSAPVSWAQFINPSPANINSPSAASLGSAAGTIQLGGKTIQVNYAGDVRSVGIATNWSWVWSGNTAPFLSTLVPNIPDPAHLLGVFGGSQAMNTLTFSEPVTDPILLFYSIGGGGASVTYEFDRPFTIVSGSTGMAGMGEFVNPSGNILRGTEGYGVIQFSGTFSTLSFKVPTAEYWSAFTVGLKPANTCPVSVICNNNNTCEAGESCNCPDCTNGGTDDKDHCGLSNSTQMVCKKDINNSTTTGAFNSVTAQENFNTVNNKLATILSQPGNANIPKGEFGTAATELKMTQYDWKDTAGNFILFTSFTQGEVWMKVKELLSIPASAQVLWSTSSIKYENDNLGDNECYLYSYVIQQASGVQKQIFFATEFLPGYGWRKIYFVSKDYPLSTVTTGTEVCQNFTNPTLFGKPLALGSPTVGSSGIAPFCLEQGFRGNSTVINSSALTGWLTLWKANGTGWEPNQNGDKINEIRCCGIPDVSSTNGVQVGACCPAGKQWSSVQNKCVVECEPLVTLKNGSALTTVKNTAGEAFSANTQCANKQISIAPCSLTSGAVSAGTSPSGNKLYSWPKSSSGLSKDYNLVEINGQCWFADNLEEKPSLVPTPPGAWDNYSPHNDYGLYSYAGTGVNRPEGYLYQFDAATNMALPSGAPLDRQKGVCPSGWHVATDCEFQYVEHTLGMTVAEQQAIGARNSGSVGSAMKADGNSGFDLPLSGNRYYNTGFNNGGSEGDLWSSECFPTGCVMRIFGISSNGVYRVYGPTTNSNHHTAGSVRCVQDGSATAVNTCPANKCAEGQYYCSSENKCKPAGATCTTPTCNNNNTCELGESCDCADCNDKPDHCGINTSGQQLICTKDTVASCYTDKFPFCLSGCLDGYTRNASGQCVQGSTNTTNSTGEQWMAYIGAYYIYLAKTPVETNIVGGQTFYIYNPEKVIPLSTMSKATFLADPVTAIKNAPLLPVGTAPLASRNIFNVAQLQFESVATQNSTLQYVTQFIAYRYLCRESKAGSTKCSYNNELVFSPGTGTTLGGDIYAPATGDNTYIFYAKAEKLGTFTVPPAPTPSTNDEQWLAYTYPGYASSYIILSKLPIVPTTVAGKTFYIYNPERIITGMSEATFLANPVTAIKNATVLPIGNTRDVTRLIFNMAQLQSESAATQSATIDSITSFVPHRYMCTEDKVGATNCSNNGNMGWAPCYGTVAGGDIYVTKSNSGSGITYALGQKLGTFTLPDASSCQNFTYPIEGNGFVKNDAASVTKYCTQKSFTSGSVVSTDSNGAGTSTWNGTAWTFSGASQSFSKEVQCCGGTVSTPVCQSFPNATAHGGYLHMAPPSITQFCKESGFDYASLKSWYMQSGSLRVWNGTSWYEDVTGGATQDLQCCKNSTTTTTTACFTPPAGYTPSATPPALPSTAKYQSKSLLADGTVNDGITGYSPIPCDNCYLPGAKTGQPNPISFKIPSNAGATGSGKYYAFDIISNAVFINMCLDNVDLKIFFNTVLQHSFTTPRTSVYAWGLRIVPDSNNPGYGWVGKRKDTAYNRYYLVLDKDNASYENWQYLKIPDEVKFDYKQTVVDHCPGSKGTGGSWMYYYGFIADAGFDASKVATAALPVCQTQTTTSTTTSTNPGLQLGACCPPGSAWNSTENRCIPTTCGEGQFYCSAQKKCLAGGTTCETTVCNNDGVCSGEESCQCTDCVNGGGDDKDKCSIIGGVQAMCSDDNLSDGKPGACCLAPKKWNSTANGGAGACVECNNTQAPSELQAGVDQPYITCTGNGDTTKTHFKYRITKQGSTTASDIFTSEPFTVGTQVLHTASLALGTYTVECFYGTAASVDTTTTATPHSCTKTTVVSDAANGCSRLYPYKGSTLSDEMISNTAFDASFRCGSRKPVTGTVTNPYMFRMGTTPFIYLPFDSLISELFNGLAIGPVSQQTQNYNFTTGNTDVSCAVKIGGGYSTNSACKLTACSGANCNTPQTFSVIHSGDLTCTSENTGTYNIGCNPEASDPVRNSCIAWFRNALNAASTNVPNGVKFTVSFTFNSPTPTPVDCIKYTAGSMPGGLNLSDNVVCQTTLNNGERYQIYAADTTGRIDSLQSTAKTVERDRDEPTMPEIKYYTDETLTTEVAPTAWYNKPLVALAVCSDTPLNESTACACSSTVDPTSTDASSWSLGSPNNLIGADLMRYTRTIATNFTSAQTVRIVDKAGNQSPVKTLSVALDTKTPLITLTESGAPTAKTVTITASDLESKIWKTTTTPSNPTGATTTNTNTIIYRVGPKADIANLIFDATCGIATPTYATIAETQSTSFPTQATATVSNINTNTQIMTYCIRDNAGNTARGIYPAVTNSCFSATNMSTIPNLDTYAALTKTRLDSTTLTDSQKYGYSFSENTTDANCFRGILASNVTTLLANQLTPKTTTSLSNWNTDRANLKNTSTPNTNDYYYYTYPTTNTLDIIASPTGTGAKAVVVEGGDIRIKTDITYTGGDKTLTIIARKNANGQGGNIEIDAGVKNIDAILIADGGAMKTTDATTPGERLTINGRLYSYNTRAGSLKTTTTTGSDLIDATSPKKFINSTLTNATSLTDARIQDLERFRPMFTDSLTTCSLHINYLSFTTSNLPVLLRRPSGFGGETCGF